MSTVTSKTIANCLLLIILGFNSAVASNYYVPNEAPPVPSTPAAVHIAKDLAASINGKASLVAATGSMLPTLTPVDIVVYRPVTFDEIKVGDIIIFEAGEKSSHECDSCTLSLYAHRVIEKVSKMVSPRPRVTLEDHHIVVTKDKEVLAQYLTTKGDHNDGPDSFKTSKEKIKGLIVYVVNGQTGEVRDMQTTLTAKE